MEEYKRFWEICKSVAKILGWRDRNQIINTRLFKNNTRVQLIIWWRLNHIMTKFVHDEGSNSWFFSVFVMGLQKAFQICNYSNTITGSSAFMVYSKILKINVNHSFINELNNNELNSSQVISRPLYRLLKKNILNWDQKKSGYRYLFLNEKDMKLVISPHLE